MVGSWHILNRFPPEFSRFSAMMGPSGTMTGGVSGGAGAGPAGPNPNI
jgi:hypothetical protein